MLSLPLSCLGGVNVDLGTNVTTIYDSIYKLLIY